MFSFDASKDWVVLISPEVPAAKKAGEELAHYIELLRKQAGLIQKVPIQDTSEPAPHDYIPQILLTTTGEGGNQNGFSWRAGNDRIEICGVSGPGLREGVFDFLSALGIGWPERTRERLPPPDRAHPYVYDLRTARANAPSGTGKIRRRRLIFGKFPLTKNDVSWIIWAARNKADAVVLPLRDDAYSPELSGKSSRDALVKTAEQYGLIIERGGWDLSLLVPRRLFRSNRELFRMDRGKRKKDFNFCPTNPETMGVLKKEAEGIFRACPGTDVFHLWPDRTREKTWCACPACRAFTPEEQNRIAANTAADILAEIYPEARVSYFENTGEAVGIEPRKNMFKLTRLPDGPDTTDLFRAE